MKVLNTLLPEWVRNHSVKYTLFALLFLVEAILWCTNWSLTYQSSMPDILFTEIFRGEKLPLAYIVGLVVWLLTIALFVIVAISDIKKFNAKKLHGGGTMITIVTIVAFLSATTPTVHAQGTQPTPLLGMLPSPSTPSAMDYSTLEFFADGIVPPDAHLEFQEMLIFQPAFGWLVLAIVVLVVGTYVLVTLYRICKRFFNRPPPPPKKSPEVFGGGEDSYAASAVLKKPAQCYSRGFQAAAVGVPVYTSVELSGTIMDDEIDGLWLDLDIKNLGPESMVNGWEEAKTVIREHGVDLGEIPGQTFYGRNGLPVTAQQVPITIDTETATVTVSNGGYQVIIQSSDTLVNPEWYTVCTLNIPVDKTVKFMDVSDAGHQFFRFNLRH